jgi:hypothetical protein
VVTLVKIAACLIGDAVRWVVLLFRSTKSLEVENLFLRRQLALYIERGVKPRRIDAATATARGADASHATVDSQRRTSRPSPH